MKFQVHFSEHHSTLRSAMNQPATADVYEFTTFRTYLAAQIGQARSRNPRFSVRTISTRMGIKSPATLSMVLKGTAEDIGDLDELNMELGA